MKRRRSEDQKIHGNIGYDLYKKNAVNEIYENTVLENNRLVKELTKKVKNNKMDKSLSSNKKEDKIKLLHEQGFTNIRQATQELGMKAKDI